MTQTNTRRLIRPALMLAMCCVLFTTPVSAEEAGAKPVQPEMVVYKQTTDAKDQPVELRLHVFKPEGWSEEDQRPAIVFFFGGGWVGGTPKQFFPHCEQLAGLGMVAISAEYRVNRTHGTAPQACVEDGKSAIRYVRGHAEQLGVDPKRIVAAGGSAGGHVAACTALAQGFEARSEARSPISSQPNLMILFNPVIDTSLGGFGAKRLGDDAIALSPLHQVKRTQPPSLILHGDADKTVKIGAARAFAERSREAGADCRLMEYEGAGHGFFNHTSFRKPKAGDPDYFKLTTAEVVVFLKKHGYIAETEED